MHPANERRRYIVTSLFGWAHTQNNPWIPVMAAHHLSQLLIWLQQAVESKKEWKCWDWNILGEIDQYHSCWCPGFLPHQVTAAILMTIWRINVLLSSTNRIWWLQIYSGGIMQKISSANWPLEFGITGSYKYVRNHTYWGLKNNQGMQSKNDLQNLWGNIVFLIDC